MKKILLAIFLSVVLLAVTGGSALAVPDADCCAGSDCGPDPETCEGRDVNCDLATGIDTGTCVSTVVIPPTPGAVTGGGGPPQKLKDYCELGSDVTIKSGTVTVNESGSVADKAGTPTLSGACTKVDPCVFQKGFTVGKSASTLVSVPTATNPLATEAVGASIDSWGMVCLLNTVHSVTNWLFYILLIAVVLMGVIGGVVYMTSAGNSEKAEKGKNVIIYAIIGLVLALVARLVPSVVRMIVGM